eukprot:GHVR01188656.1.p1 GENE.GHVR01188656.1~~GHVR01188656.1.p1  ORF type:complete len:107 (-),score=13.36 GHVR01188656.1:106-426(-)
MPRAMLSSARQPREREGVWAAYPYSASPSWPLRLRQTCRLRAGPQPQASPPPPAPAPELAVSRRRNLDLQRGSWPPCAPCSPWHKLVPWGITGSARSPRAFFGLWS